MSKMDKEILENRNRPLQRIKWLFICLFVALILYILYFILIEGEQRAYNDYNPRLGAMEERVVRGDILTSDGQVIATTRLTDQGTSVRTYPMGPLYAHTTGYVGFNRKTSLEYISNDVLIRTPSPLLERLKYDFTKERAYGYNVRTTLNHALQEQASELLGDRVGAIVALDPRNGAILAMVSKPTFDPNTITQDFETILAESEDGVEGPLLNRVTQGLYPPGSTFKTLTTIAYLESYPEDDFFHYCLGEGIYANRMIHCYGNTAHGRLSLEQAFARSCNTSYAQIGTELDKGRLGEIAEQFLFNEKIELDLSSEEVMASQFVLNEDSSDVEMVETAFGQGKTLITPLNNALIAAAIARDGSIMQPHLIQQIETHTGEILEKTPEQVYRTIMSEAMANKLQGYMLATNAYGTAKSMDQSHYLVASKTGTAENKEGEGKEHAWYIGYAPADDPQIVLSIIVENVGSSSANSVPIADELFKFYLIN